MLVVSDLQKAFAAEAVLAGVSFEVPTGETLAVLGRSGGGKTTLLKIIAGLESADGGAVMLSGVNLLARPPEQRGAVYLYQEPLLFPHLDVYENVAFGLRLRRVREASMRARVEALLDEVGLSDHLRKQPHQLSGGQQQRVAFARAAIVEPAALLLDEPFGKLDAETRAAMQALFTRIAHAKRITTVFVTHDLKEALVVGDWFGHLRDGHLVTYPSREAFVADPRTGAQAEAAFWQHLATPESARADG